MQPKATPLQRPRSVTALSGGAVLAGTRTLKDWRLAADLQKRADRFDRWHEKRSAAWASDHYSGVSGAGPVVRSSCFTEDVAQQSSLSWHEELVKTTFAKLKSTVTGEVGVDQLESSFAMMRIPIDASTFTRYACELLAAGKDCVNYKEFLAFHKAVWANQSAAVRRYAGDPSATGSGDSYTGSAACRRLMRSSSVPSGASLRELRDNECMLRSAFKRYEQSPGYLPRGELPALFQDVGLDLGIPTDLGLPGSNRLQKFLSSQLPGDGAEGKDEVSLNEFIEMQNKYIATLEGEKGDRRPENVVPPKLNHDAMLREYMSSAMASRPPSAVTREAALQDKVALVGEFATLVADADAALPPDSPGASRKKLMRITGESS